MSEASYETAMAGRPIAGEYPEILASIETLERQVVQLEEIVGIFSDHLAPVLRPAVPEPSDIRKVNDPSGVQIADTLTNTAEKVAELRDRLVRLNARVAI